MNPLTRYSSTKSLSLSKCLFRFNLRKVNTCSSTNIIKPLPISSTSKRNFAQSSSKTSQPPAQILEYKNTNVNDILEEMKARYNNETLREKIPTAFKEYFETNGEVSVRGALNLTLYEELERDPDIIILGEEVAEYQGAYKITKGLWEKFGSERVWDTPITEMGFTGIGVGAALNGLKPIVEFMSFNFSMQAIDQIVNSAGKLHYMSGGRISVPIVFRGCNGAAKAVAAQHSQDFSPWYSSVPGLKVLTIYDIFDARACLKAAIQDPDPVVLLENEIMYGSRWKVTPDFFNPKFPPAEIGKARIMKEGKDLTICSHGRMIHFSLEAANILEKELGVSVEVINMRSLRPFDRDTLVQSVIKTHRLVYVEEGWPQCGIAAEACAIVMEAPEAFDSLDAPVERVCGIDVPMPYCPNLEEMVLPSTNGIVQACKRALKGK